MDLYKTISWEMGLAVERSRAALYRQIKSEVSRLCTSQRAASTPRGPRMTARWASINNLDGSGGLIKDHGDVTSDAITYAFVSAVART
jgi:hypothetical protein